MKTAEDFPTEAALIRDAILDHFLDTGEPARPAEIAARLGWPEAKIRRVVSAALGAVPGTSAEQIEVPRYSKIYPGTQVGYALAWAYTPTKAYMRERLLAVKEG